MKPEAQGELSNWTQVHALLHGLCRVPERGQCWHPLWGSEELENLPKVTEPRCSRTGLGLSVPQSLGLRPPASQGMLAQSWASLAPWVAAATLPCPTRWTSLRPFPCLGGSVVPSSLLPGAPSSVPAPPPGSP